MGICKLFGMCADETPALHEVDVAVSLVGLEDNQGLVYVASVDEKTGEVDGSIVTMDNEDIYAYEGTNLIEPASFTEFNVAEEQRYALEEARSFSIGEFSFLDITPWTLDPSQNVDAAFVQEAFAGDYDVVEDFRNIVQDLNDERSEIYEQLRANGIDPEGPYNPDNARHVDNAEVFGQRTFAEGKLAEAEAILDRLELADSLSDIGENLKQEIEVHSDISAEQKAILTEEVALGAMDGPGATMPVPTNDMLEP